MPRLRFMNSDNILSVNIPNGVSIIIMGAVGAILLTALKKARQGRSNVAGNAPRANFGYN